MKRSGRIEKLCPLLCQHTCVFSCHQNLRKDLCQLPRIPLSLNLCVKLFHHLLVKLLLLNINWKHAGGFSNTKHLPSAYFPVNISCKGRKKRHIFDVLFLI